MGNKLERLITPGYDVNSFIGNSLLIFYSCIKCFYVHDIRLYDKMDLFMENPTYK